VDSPFTGRFAVFCDGASLRECTPVGDFSSVLGALLFSPTEGCGWGTVDSAGDLNQGHAGLALALSRREETMEDARRDLCFRGGDQPFACGLLWHSRQQ